MQLDLLNLLPARQGHFKLESGLHGNLWLDLEPLFVQPQRLQPLVKELAAQLARHNPQAICGPLVGGAFLAQQIASELGLEFIFTERFVPLGSTALYSVEYHLPPALRPLIQNKAVAIVDDAISAGSSVRATFDELKLYEARPVVIGSLLALGTKALDYFAAENIPVVSLSQLPYPAWPPADCPLCAAGVPLSATL